MAAPLAKNSSKSDKWYLEFFAISASLLGLAGMVALLARNDNKPIFHWHGVTLNALVSVLSTISRTTLALVLAESISQWKWMLFGSQRRHLIDFDTIESASRGPLGSTKLLWNIRDSPILYIGALTTIFAAAFDPFVQQLIQNQSRMVYENDPAATIARSQRYSKGNEYVLGSTRPIFVIASADFSMQSAVLYGLNQPFGSIRQQAPFHCPSGNCTWSPFESLAVCSTCHDLSQMMNSSRTKVTEPLYVDLQPDSDFSGRVTNFTLPNGLYIDNLDDINIESSSTTTDKAQFGVTLMTTFGTSNVSKTNSMHNLDTLIWATSILKVRPNASNNSAIWPNTPIEAIECALYYCVNKYNSSVVNATLQEIVSTTASQRSPNSWQPLGTEGILSKGPGILGSYANVPWNNRTDLMIGDGFNLSQAAVDGISVYFESLLSKNVSGVSSSKLDKINGFVIRNRQRTAYTPDANQVLYSSTDLNSTFIALATSMSNTIRAGDDKGRVSSGRTGRILTFYHIKWAWVVLPGMVTLSGFVHLIMTAHASKIAGVVPWKSSPMATLSRGKYVADTLAGLDSVSAMEMKAKTEAVILFPRQSTEMLPIILDESQVSLYRLQDENHEST